VNTLLRYLTRNPLVALLALILLMALAWGGKAKWDLWRMESAHEEVTTERDALAADAAAERRRADGWQAVFAEDTGHLFKKITSRDSVLAIAARDLKASGVRITRLTSMVASLQGQTSSPGEPDALPDSETDTVPASWSGEIDDGLLRAPWTFFRFDPRLALDYVVEIPIQLIEGESGDGRTLVLARALDPRASVTFDELLVHRFPPVVVEHCSIWTRGKYAAGGGLIGWGLGLFSGGR